MEQRIQKNLWRGWVLGEILGVGSYGKVYEIHRTLFGNVERAALKVISIPKSSSELRELYSEGYDDDSIRETFSANLSEVAREYSMMRNLGCTNVVACNDIEQVEHENEIGWDILIRMELLTPLLSALPEKYSEEFVCRLGIELCEALIRCKKADIVHRDIKPQNIFISPNGDFKLGDFGIAKTMEKTIGGTKAGTYDYMAPEVYFSRPYGSTVDIYSLGLVLYWLMNKKRLPFVPLPPEKLRPGVKEEARLRRLRGDLIPYPADGSEALKQAVLKACSFEAKDRFGSAEEMQEALRAAQQLQSSAVCVIASDTEHHAGIATNTDAAFHIQKPTGIPTNQDKTVYMFSANSSEETVNIYEGAVEAHSKSEKSEEYMDTISQLLRNGNYYLEKNPTQENLEQAFLFFRQAAEQGSLEAIERLGFCYYWGKGVPQSYKMAVSCYQEAADNGYAKAQRWLGLCYEHGLGVEKNLEKAIQLYQLSAGQGYAEAQTGLGMCYHVGIGMEKDFEKAVYWYEKAAAQDEIFAQRNLSLCYARGEGVEKNLEKAFELSLKVAQSGDPELQTHVGLSYEEGRGVEKDLEKAVYWYQKAAVQGNDTAQYHLGKCYEYAKGTRQNIEKAIDWYTKAASLGNVEAQKKLGSCYEFGEGVDINLAEASLWYKKAANQGDKSAKAMLDLCEKKRHSPKRSFFGWPRG